MTDVTLTQPHTHAGVAYLAGDRLEVDALSAAWLIAVGVATAASTPSRGKTPRPSPSAIAAPTESTEPTESTLSTDQEL